MYQVTYIRGEGGTSVVINALQLNNGTVKVVDLVPLTVFSTEPHCYCKCDHR